MLMRVRKKVTAGLEVGCIRVSVVMVKPLKVAE